MFLKLTAQGFTKWQDNKNFKTLC